MMYALTAAGLVILLLAGEALVRGAVGLARTLGIPPLLIGLTVVAFGTSAPELFVSINAALNGLPGISIGNIVGSNIANIWLVLGAAALLAPTPTNQPRMVYNVALMLGATALFIGLCLTGQLGRPAGFVLFGGLVFYLGFSALEGIRSRANGRKAEEALEDLAAADAPLWQSLIWLVVGLVGLPVGAKLIVTGGEVIATTFGVSDALIGLTVVAIGTSLPELATTVLAAYRKHTDVAVGNVVGSNLFNYLAIGGATALVAPIDVPPIFARLDLWVMAGACLSILPFTLSHRSIRWPTGFLFMMAYIGYITLIIINHPTA